MYEIMHPHRRFKIRDHPPGPVCHEFWCQTGAILSLAQTAPVHLLISTPAHKNSPTLPITNLLQSQHHIHRPGSRLWLFSLNQQISTRLTVVMELNCSKQ